MKVSKNNRLGFFSSLYQAAREKQESLFESFRLWDDQYRGSREVEGGLPVSTVRNITYELIENQVSTDIPAPQVTSYRGDAKKEKNARSIEALLLSLRDRLPFERLNDMEERYTYIYGGALMLVEWDDRILHGGEVGSVKVTGISPADFVGQPGIYEIEDMEYCFLVFDTTAEEVSRRYGSNGYGTTRYGSGFSGSGLGEDLSDDEPVTLVICFYKNEEGLVSRFVWSGEQVLSDIEDYTARKRRFCTRCGEEEADCRCGRAAKFYEKSEEFEVLAEDIRLTDGSLLPKGSKIRRYRPNRFPLVLRRNTSREKSLFGQSDCAFIRPQQLEINKVLSRVHEKLMMAGIYPYKPDDCQFRYDNSIGGKVLNLRPGESPNQFGIIDTSPDIAQDLSYVEATYRDAKRILGISDAFTGEDEEAGKSGEARKIQVARAEGRLISKRVMKNAAYADMDHLIFTLYLAYADEPRRLTRRDSLGRAEDAAFCRYDFLEYDPKEGVYVYDDDFLFSVESETPAKDEREALWKYNLENYLAGSFGSPGQTEALSRYWEAQARCGYPGAKEYAALFLKSHPLKDV